MPNWLVAQAVVVWLVYQYARSRDVPVRSKRIVVWLTAASFLARCLWPAASIPAALLQFAVGLCLAFRRMVSAPNDRAGGAVPTRPRHRDDPSAIQRMTDH